jgi:CRISPR-associated endonuclease Cas3-HD
MLSAPKEGYQTHIVNSLSEWEKISNRFLPSLSRIFNGNENTVNQAIRRMIFSHDIGKLTKSWQAAIVNGKKGPPHSALSAAYLFQWNKKLEKNNNIGNSCVFAVLIHHIDSAVANENLESPDSQTVRKFFLTGGNMVPWHIKSDETISTIATGLSIGGVISVEEVTIKVLTELSDTLRLWSKCPRLLDQHKHRLLASSVHHILKICDWRAATEREVADEEKEVNRSVLEVLLNGGILP